MKTNKANFVPILIIILIFLKNSGFLLKIPKFVRKIKLIAWLLISFIFSETVLNVIEIYGYFYE